MVVDAERGGIRVGGGIIINIFKIFLKLEIAPKYLGEELPWQKKIFFVG